MLITIQKFNVSIMCSIFKKYFFQQESIKLITSDSKDISNVSKYFEEMFFLTLHLSDNL